MDWHTVGWLTWGQWGGMCASFTQSCDFGGVGAPFAITTSMDTGTDGMVPTGIDNGIWLYTQYLEWTFCFMFFVADFGRMRIVKL